MRRDLLRDRDGEITVRGAVVVDGDDVRWDGLAAETFNGLRRRLGDVPAARQLIELGWSNGMGNLYLGEPSEHTTPPAPNPPPLDPSPGDRPADAVRRR